MGMIAQMLVRAFWPLWSVVIFAVGLLMLGLHDSLPFNIVTGLVAGLGVLAIGALVYGFRRMFWPSRSAALARVDGALAGRPIAAVLDAQAIGEKDAGSVALWHAHQDRMMQAAQGARAIAPDLRVAASDPYGVRFVALLVLVVGVVFGSFGRVASVGDLAQMGGDLAAGPTWEGWVEPPAYTDKPNLYLADIKDVLTVPVGSLVTVRLYGEVGALRFLQSVNSAALSTEIGEEKTDLASNPIQNLTIDHSGELEIAGPNGRVWRVDAIEDAAPTVRFSGIVDIEADGTMSQPFKAADDYEVVGGTAIYTLDLAAVERRFGLAVAPEGREDLVLDLPLPISGSRAEFDEALVENLSQHPWANLPVTLTLSVMDAKEQSGHSAGQATVLPGRRFFDPLAAALIEQRRDLLWSRENAPNVALILRAISHRPSGFFRRETNYLRLRVILRRLETMHKFGGLNPEARDEISAALWELALRIEDGDLSDALERMRRAQERLSEAIKNGASEEEIEALMQEMREATNDFMRQRAQQQAQEGETQQDQQNQEDAMRMSAQDIQDMMDRIQELMEEGRTAEAQQALDEFQEMMENMRVTQDGEAGEGERSQGAQSMQELSETLKEQQGLSDQAFRDLQEQFNPNARAGESQDNEGQSGGQGRGESHEGEGGQGEGEGEGETQEGQQGSPSGDGGDDRSLAQRQQELLEELQRQKDGLPGAGTPEGDAATSALNRAEEAMRQAENALQGNDLAEAIDQQAQAMEALRDGMRNLGEAMAEQERERDGQQGQAQGESRKTGQDPLGRSAGSKAGGDENILQGEDVYRRARDLLDEIRRRTGEEARPDVEIDYLRRLLERF